MNEYYSPWEWQPIENMPSGCNEIRIRYADGTTGTMCSCDYWWKISQDSFEKQPIGFRYD